MVELNFSQYFRPHLLPVHTDPRYWFCCNFITNVADKTNAMFQLQRLKLGHFGLVQYQEIGGEIQHLISSYFNTQYNHNHSSLAPLVKKCLVSIGQLVTHRIRILPWQDWTGLAEVSVSSSAYRSLTACRSLARSGTSCSKPMIHCIHEWL